MTDIDSMEEDDPERVIKHMKALLEQKSIQEPPMHKIRKHSLINSGNTGLALVHSLRIGLRQLGGLEPPDEAIPVVLRKRKPRSRKIKAKSKKRVARKKKKKPKRKVITRPVAILKSKKIKPKRRPKRSAKVPKPKRILKKTVKKVKAKPKKKIKPKLSGKEKLARLLMKARRTN